ncbi:VCBS repeat-containing protein [Myxococcus sp. AM011]|uniref:FG-GAP repeat domain-containing protein n=1 Tax=Myxococcus sp. AM011 TaxID=2745200 RepID=UPI001595B40E|nr:VCBS repeat-containing protein [Myxococcus sp. AM011]
MAVVLPRLSAADPACVPADPRPICHTTDPEDPPQAVPPGPFWVHEGKRFFVIGVFDYPTTATSPDGGPARDFPNINKTDLAQGELGRVGFNAIIHKIHDVTPADLDKFEQHGVHVLLSAWNWKHLDEPGNELHWVREKDAQHHVGSDLDLRIQELKNKSALLGYDSMDELGWNSEGGGQLVRSDGVIDAGATARLRERLPTLDEAVSFREFVNARDPAHPVYYTEVAATNSDAGIAPWDDVPGFSPSQYRKWMAVANAWGQDRYPITLLPDGGSPPFPTAPLNRPAESTEAMRALYDDDFMAPYTPTAPILMVLQGQGLAECCDWDEVNGKTGRRPNYIETRYMAYSSIIQGARGIFWWGTDVIGQDSQLWWDIKKVAAQLRFLEPMLVSDSRPPLTLSPGLVGMQRAVGTRHIVIVANPSPVQVTSNIIPSGWGANVQARSLFEQRGPLPYNSTLQGWTDTFGPWEVHVYTNRPQQRRKDDFDGDGTSDFTWYWPSPAMPQAGMLTVQASSLPRPMRFAGGLPGDISLTGDYDGDGITDYAVYTPAAGTTPGFFTVWRSQGQHWSWFNLGGPGDIPLAADYDGDGITDIAVYERFATAQPHPDTFEPVYGKFRWIPSQTGGDPVARYMGEPDDTPVVGDFDKDGKDDHAMHKAKDSSGWGGWFTVRKSQSGIVDWDTMGQVGDIPVVGDYDGDGFSDLAIYTPRWPTDDGGGYFTVVHSSTGTSHVKFLGGLGDVPVTGDYDGDGKTDFAVYRPRTSTPAAGGDYTVIFSSTQLTSVKSRSGVRPGELPMGRAWQQ